MCVCVHKKQAVYSALIIAQKFLAKCNMLLALCGLLRPASCTDRAIHAFPKKTQGSKIFSSEL